MIIFDQLRISDDGKRLYVNLHVNNAPDFDNISVKSVTVMTALDSKGDIIVSEANPYCATKDFIYKKEFEGGTRQVDLVIDKLTLYEARNNTNLETGEPINSSKPTAAVEFSKSDFNSDLFFVYVECIGSISPSSCFPCRMDEQTTLGVTFDENILYQRVMDYTKQLADDCNMPNGFIDFILRWNAFKASVETEHYIPAIKFYKMLFDDYSGTGRGTFKPCGCHG